MDRRRISLGLALAGPIGLVCPGFAQPVKASARIGWIADPATSTPGNFEALRAGMRDRGWVVGRNLNIEERWIRRDQGRAVATELEKGGADVLVATGSIGFDLARAPGQVPVVFVIGGDPVEGRVVSSLARPQANCTGLTLLAYELIGKRLELLRQALPGAQQVAFMFQEAHAGARIELREAQAAATRLGLVLRPLPLDAQIGVEPALQLLAEERPQALLTSVDGLVSRHAGRIAAASTRVGVPAVSGWGQLAAEGYLLTYGPSLSGTYHYLAGHVDKILRGTKAGEIPVELPPKVELVLNLAVARSLGIHMPPSLLARADRLLT